MQKHLLEYRVDSPDERTCVYRLTGDLFGSPEGYSFQDAVRQKIADGVCRIVLDLSAVHRIDSSGVGILVTTMWSASKAGGGLALAALPASVERVLGIAMLLEHITHAPSVEQAVRKLDGMSLPGRAE